VLLLVLNTENEYAPIEDLLGFQTREDPFRVRFLNYKVDSNTVTRDLPQIRKEKELASGVYEVRTDSDKDLYIYKEVDRPLYEPRDSKVLEQELRNLERFRGIKVIVQLLAAVITELLHQRVSRGIHVSVRHNLPMPQNLQSVPLSIPSFLSECTRDTGKAVQIGVC
jgi:hypothetical protein